MKTAIIGLLALLVAAAMSQPVAKTEEAIASKRTTILTDVQNIPDSESEASENKEKRGAARLTPVTSNSLTNDRPGQSINSNHHQNHQLSDIAQLTQIPQLTAQSPMQQLFAPHPYSFILPITQPKLGYSPKSPFFLPPQQQQLIQLPAFSPHQNQQYMLILPPQHSPAQHQILMLIAPPPTATGFHYITPPHSPHAQNNLPPQHINFYAGQPQHQLQQQPHIQRELPLLQTIPQQSQQQYHIQTNQQPIQQQPTRIVYSQEQPHISYQTIPQEHQQPLLQSPSLKLQSHQQQQQIQQQQIQQQQIQQQHQQQTQQQQYLSEESIPTPAALVSSYGTRLHSQPTHHNQQQQYKTIIKV